MKNIKRKIELITPKDKINLIISSPDDFYKFIQTVNNEILDEQTRNEIFKKIKKNICPAGFTVEKIEFFTKLFNFIKDLKCDKEIKNEFLSNIINESLFNIKSLNDISNILSIENSIYDTQNENIINKYLDILRNFEFPGLENIEYHGSSDLIDIKKIIIYLNNFQNDEIKNKYLNIVNLILDNDIHLRFYVNCVNDLISFLKDMNNLNEIQDEQMRNKFLTTVNNVIDRVKFLLKKQYIKGLKLNIYNIQDFIFLMRIADTELWNIMKQTKIYLSIKSKIQNKADFINVLYNISNVSKNTRRCSFLTYLIKSTEIDWDNNLMRVDSDVIKSIIYNIKDKNILKIVKNNYIAQDRIFYNNLQDYFSVFKKILENYFYSINIDNSILIQKVSDAIINDFVNDAINALSIGELNSLREATYILDNDYNIFCQKAFVYEKSNDYLIHINSLEEILNKYYEKNTNFFQKIITYCDCKSHFGNYFFDTIEDVWLNKTKTLTKEEIKNEINNYEKGLFNDNITQQIHENTNKTINEKTYSIKDYLKSTLENKSNSSFTEDMSKKAKNNNNKEHIL